MKREYFLHLLNLYGCKRGAEIGVFRGEHAKLILKNVEDLQKLYLVDTWEHCSKNPEDDYNECKRKFGKDKRVVIIQNSSNQTAHNYKRIYKENMRYQFVFYYIMELLDFVYIDGDHSYEFCSSDLLAWYPKIKVGGIMCGHDWNWPTVRDAVTDFCSLMKIPVHIWGEECSNMDGDTNPCSWFFERR